MRRALWPTAVQSEKWTSLSIGVVSGLNLKNSGVLDDLPAAQLSNHLSHRVNLGAFCLFTLSLSVRQNTKGEAHRILQHMLVMWLLLITRRKNQQHSEFWPAKAPEEWGLVWGTDSRNLTHSLLGCRVTSRQWEEAIQWGKEVHLHFPTPDKSPEAQDKRPPFTSSPDPFSLCGCCVPLLSAFEHLAFEFCF